MCNIFIARAAHLCNVVDILLRTVRFNVFTDFLKVGVGGVGGGAKLCADCGRVGLTVQKDQPGDAC